MGVRTIVVGVDFSTSSEIAAQQALAVARRTGGRLVLAHAAAMPEAPSNLPESMRGTAEAYLRVLQGRVAEDERQLTELAARLSDQGVDIAHQVVDGFADDALVAAAAALDAELLVTGSHGRRGLSRLLLGSTAERVVRSAECPVLVARGAPTAADGGYRKILVATDFSEAAARGLVLALDLAADGGTVDLVHFWLVPSMARAHATDEVDATAAEIRAGMVEHGERRGADAVAAIDSNKATVTYHLREEDAVDGIEAWAIAHDCDLIVVGGHGHRGLRRLLVGSVAANTVRHAPCSVLVAR